ncbi:gamma-glutamyltransferase [Gluconobacter roseus]|uniref:Gamma-glutamyltranspeptidase n=1 Tax=Gluconobacter roseus NBRC 3990 TaxID=1307950 RepID=A0A4Y3M3I8_9PROT|nr:gamma-glutamyltransferase [Gluconobacter roseus]KXV44296.1 gamma-glutamyltranspeptidase [Gluconobacter roseus]GBR44537.1 gamma-glutamyltranspeptidase [Gluconobacter roseus NBRC 3990]GEB02656.1 gamma-glutamyltranspeptidase [Gluconobacter roseus NBRC 3990]GLP93115.1 gamma-glutamyltranspeptidase [Gluconobacter roseus NBRC 3990]
MAHRQHQISTPDAPQGRRVSSRFPAALMATAASGLLLGACSWMPGVQFISNNETAAPAGGSIGTVVADEPQAALIGHDVLARGGNAADAATATALALGVTLPSRASFGGGGACLVSRPGEPAQAITFLPRPGTSKGGDRPAGTAAEFRGLYLMQLHYGTVDFNDLVAPALNLASTGITVSRTLAADLAAVRPALLADDNARAIFGRGEATTVAAGDSLAQPRLAGFLERIRVAGVGDLYNGALADVYVTAAQKAGGGLNDEDMRQTLPVQTATLTTRQGGVDASFLAPPADGGLGAALRYTTGASAQGAVAAWRASGNTTLAAAQAALDSGHSGNGTLPALPASTSFVVTDHSGMAVACAVSENNLFGTGRIAGSTGVVLGASPARTPQPLLSAAVLRDQRNLRAVIAASGQNEAADAVGDAARAAAHDTPIPHEGAGRINAILCHGNDSCRGSTDPCAAGLAAGTTNDSRN